MMKESKRILKYYIIKVINVTVKGFKAIYIYSIKKYIYQEVKKPCLENVSA